MRVLGVSRADLMAAYTYNQIDRARTEPEAVSK